MLYAYCVGVMCVGVMCVDVALFLSPVCLDAYVVRFPKGRILLATLQRQKSPRKRAQSQFARAVRTEDGREF